MEGEIERVYMVCLRTLKLRESARDGAAAATTGHLHMHGEMGQQKMVRQRSGSNRTYGTDLDVELVGVLGNC
jgi:hypothetical protein